MFELWEAVQPFLEGCNELQNYASSEAQPPAQVGPAEGTSTHPSSHRVGGDDAGLSRKEGSGIKINASFESSMRNRIARLEQDNSTYLLDKAKGEYWAHIKDELDHTSSQGEYNIILELENRDLRIRELKHSCSSCFQQVLLRHPTLADQAPYHPPQEVLDDYLDERREALDRLAAEPVGQRPSGQGVPVEERDKREIAFLENLLSDLQKRGPAAIQPIFDQSPTISGNND